MSPAGSPRPALLAAVVAALDVVADHVVLLDPSGHVVHVNVAWQRFALDNGDDTTDWIGVDYVAASAAPCDEAGQEDPITDGLRDVLSGRRTRFEIDYDCHAPDELRWFRLLAVRTELPGIGAIVTHTDITPQRLAERALEHHAIHDRATGLRNRVSLEQHLLQLVQEGRTVDALRVDLARPANPSDLVPDEAVAQVGGVLRELFPAPATLGRWGSARLLVALAGASEDELEEGIEVLRTTLDVLHPDLPLRVSRHRVVGPRSFVDLDADVDLSRGPGRSRT